MCDHCFTQAYYSFPTEQDFAQFDLLLTAKLQLAGGLCYTGQQQLTKFAAYTTYTCPNCGSRWWLAEPDTTWRGFFLPENQALAHLAKIKRLAKARGYAGLLVLAALLLGVLSWLLKR